MYININDKFVYLATPSSFNKNNGGNNKYTTANYVK